MDDSRGAPADFWDQYVTISDPQEDAYQITLKNPGASTQSVALQVYSSDANGVPSSPQVINVIVGPGQSPSFSVARSGSFLTPPEAPPSKGWIQIDPTQAQFKQGTEPSGLIWTQIHPTNPAFVVTLHATLDGTPLQLEQLTQEMHLYEAPGLAPGVHTIEVKAFLSGQHVDDAVAYFVVLPDSSTGSSR